MHALYARGARFASRVPIFTAVAAAVLLVALLRAAPGAAQSRGVVEASSPAPNATLTTPLSAIELRFIAPIDPATTEVRLFGSGATEIPLTLAANSADPRLVVASPAQPIGDGAWTLAWSTRLADGPVVADSWPFRIASPPPPGAAPLDDRWPGGWAAVARWLATLGLGVAGGTALAARLAAPGWLAPAVRGVTAGARFGFGIAAVGATVALLAFAAQPLLLSLAADGEDIAPSLAQAIGAMPPGWLPALGAAAILALALLVRLAIGAAADRLPGWFDWAVLAPALVALSGLATARVAGQEPIPVILATLHAWASALWAGLLVVTALARVTKPGFAAGSVPGSAAAFIGSDGPSHVTVGSDGLPPAIVGADGLPQRASNPSPAARAVAASWWLLAAALASGLAAALLAAPRPIAWWTTTWGWSLIGKSALVVAAALLLYLVRSRSPAATAATPAPAPAAASAAESLAAIAGANANAIVAIRPPRAARSSPGRGRPVVAALAALSLLGGSLMVLSAAPGTQVSPTLAGIDLAAAVPLGPDGAAGRLDLALSPALPGANTVVVRLTGPDGAALPPAQAPMVSVAFSPLDHAAPPQTVNPTPNQMGGFAVAGVDLPGGGWWQADVTLVPPDGQASRVVQYLVLPDPNVTGRGPRPASDPEARAVFDRGIAFFADLRSVRFTQRLGDGSGVLFQSLTEASDGIGDRPATYRTVTQREELIIVGDTQWSRRFDGDGAWEERAAASLFLPSEWADIYAEAQGFQLGPVEEVAGEPSRVVTFYLTRGQSNAPAWYAWWVGEETGAVHREAMVSQRHYMLYTFSDFGADFGIAPPVDRQGPPAVGTSAATPAP